MTTNSPQTAPQSPPKAGVLDALVPTNPLAAVACWCGILSLIFCVAGPVLGPVALITGFISLKKGAILQQSGYGKATSAARSWIGIVTGILGTIVGIAALVWMILGRR